MAENDTQGLFNTKEGFLAKTGSNNRGWRDRYFRLKDGKLNYYKSDKDNIVIGYIDLSECIKVIKAQGKKGYGFDIHTPGRVYNLSTRTEDEIDEWICAVDVSVAISKSIYGDRRSGSILEKGRQRMDSFNSILDQDLVSLTSQDSLSNRKSEPDFHSLLEAEVKALNTRSTQLEQELKTTQSQREQLQDRIQQMKTDHEEIIKQNGEDLTVLRDQIQSLEETKSNLETVNDSLRVQVQEKEESMISLEHQLTEEIRELEEETRNLQEDLERLKGKQIEVNDQNESLSQSNADLQGTVRKMQIDYEEEIKQYKSEQNRLLARIEQLQREMGTERDNYENERSQRQRAEEQLRLSMEVCHKLEVTERERDRLKVLLTSLQQNQQSDNMSTVDELKSERLQLQVELENLRTSMSREMESIRGSCEKERNALIIKLENLEHEKNEISKGLEANDTSLANSNTLVSELQSHISTLEQSNDLLRIEKEKAMSDLIVIKKNMKERERKYNSDEENTNPNVANKDSKLSEAESRAEMATRLLKEIQAERDLLKAQVKKHGSPIKPTVSDPVDINSDPIMMNTDFKTKSQPTTAMSNFEDLPPPKPKRPTRDILDRLKC